MSEWTTYIEGPRWAGIRKFIMDLAMLTDTKLSNVEQDKGWFRETVYFTVSGERENLRRFQGIALKQIEDYGR